MTAEAFPIVFPPMDEAVFAALLAKYNSREKKEAPKLGSIYGRPSLRRIPREQFAEHVAALSAGRLRAGTERRPLIGRSAQP